MTVFNSTIERLTSNKLTMLVMFGVQNTFCHIKYPSYCYCYLLLFLGTVKDNLLEILGHREEAAVRRRHHVRHHHHHHHRKLLSNCSEKDENVTKRLNSGTM